MAVPGEQKQVCGTTMFHVHPVLLEFLKATFSALVLTAGAFMTAYFWSAWQKRRELQLAAADAFHKLYGEFFAVWKLWNSHKLGNAAVQSQNRETEWNLLDRACKAEAGIEAVVLRLASERVLSAADIEVLGKFRQAYQTLRERIRAGEPIPWNDSEHPEYLSFKVLSCRVASLLSLPLSIRVPGPKQASKALRRITSNDFEGKWLIEESRKG